MSLNREAWTWQMTSVVFFFHPVLVELLLVTTNLKGTQLVFSACNLKV
jgi:hypothetical protein